jgi:hypothetical protein
MTALLSRLLSIALRNDTGRTACRLYGLVSTGAPPGTRTPNPRIKSPKWTVMARNPKQDRQNVRPQPAKSGPVRKRPCWSGLFD